MKHPAEVVRDRLAGVTLGHPQWVANLTLFPLFAPYDAAPEYASLDEALRDGWAAVTEVSRRGSVPQLELRNDGDRAVLMIDGEELVGAKQNRVLNLTVLAPAGKVLIVPVSCVEQGRWAWTSQKFCGSASPLYSKIRALNTAAVSASYLAGGPAVSDQSELWDDIDRKSSRLGSTSPSGAMAGVYEAAARRLAEYEQLAFVDGQVGALFAIDGHPAGLDLFEHPSVMGRMLPKLVRSYALDAIETRTRKERPAGAEECARLLVEAREARADVFPAIGMGCDVRLGTPRLTGGGLVLDERLVHLGAFRRADEGEGQSSRFARFSGRRRP